MYGEPTPYGFSSTGSRKHDNMIVSGLAAVEMRRAVFREKTAREVKLTLFTSPAKIELTIEEAQSSLITKF
ncbi:MAG: hypothetical protein HQK70_02155 [Desulfamplus sp.]|nr:hypothetical protein [Desulfamplus sp.]